jgi:hypothetical protein
MRRGFKLMAIIAPPSDGGNGNAPTDGRIPVTDQCDESGQPAEGGSATGSPADWSTRCAAWAADFAADTQGRERLADWARVPESALAHVPGVGIRTDHGDSNRRAWTFPLRDARGNLVGVRTEFSGGLPSTTDGVPGLLLPADWKDRPGAVYIVTGAWNMLAMTAAGLAAVCRPSNNDGGDFLTELIRTEVPADRPIVWMGENDRRPKAGGGFEWPGRNESKRAATRLAHELKRPIGFALPPGGEKDVRSWLTGLVSDGVQWETVKDNFTHQTKVETVEPGGASERAVASTPAGSSSSAAGGGESPGGNAPPEAPVELPPPPPSPRVSGVHLQKMRASGLKDLTIRDSRWRDERDPEKIAGILNLKGKGGVTIAASLGHCAVIPHFDWNGKWVLCTIRPAAPRVNDKGKPRKYEHPADTPSALYIPPTAITAKLHESDVPFIITEGALKALMAQQCGFPAVSVPGVAGWSSRTSDGKRELRGGLTAMKLSGRTVLIVFDSDAATKPQVKREAYELQQALKAKCARVKWVPLPPKPDGSKMGLDDFLCDPAHGPEALRELIASADPVPLPNNGDLCNYEVVEAEVPKRGGKKGDTETKLVHLPRSAADVLAEVREKTGGYPVAVGNTLYAIVGEKLLALGDETRLFAHLNSVWSPFGRSRVAWGRGDGTVSKAEFFAFAVQRARQYASVSALPHFPPIESVLYAPYPEAGGDFAALKKLLGFFSPAKPVDAILLLAAICTPAWGGPAGKRPGFFLRAFDEADENGTGTGKSTAAMLIAEHLYGGYFTLRTNENFADFTKRVANGSETYPKRCVLFDNVKSDRLSWSDYESFLTAKTVNGHKHYCGDCDVPNLFTNFITMNNGTLAKDVARRFVPVQFKRPAYSAAWEPTVIAFIDRNRAAILGDIKALFESPTLPITGHGRFPEWESEILSKCAYAAASFAAGALEPADLLTPDDVIRHAGDWQSSVDADAERADGVREAVERMLAPLLALKDINAAFVQLSPSAVCELMLVATGDRRLTIASASSKLRSSGVSEFRQTRRTDWGKTRRWYWRGPDCVLDEPTDVIDFDPRPHRGWSAAPFTKPGVKAGRS